MILRSLSSWIVSSFLSFIMCSSKVGVIFARADSCFSLLMYFVDALDLMHQVKIQPGSAALFILIISKTLNRTLKELILCYNILDTVLS